MTQSKTAEGNYFEDFTVGQELRHATPRTVTEGDLALYLGLFGSRFAVTSSSEIARSIGFARSPVDDWLVFHLVFGKSVPDVSLNAVANLGYAQGRFTGLVYPGDTLSTRSKVIGVKQNSNGKTGVVYVQSTGTNQRGEIVLDYVRWVMVRKRDPSHPAPTAVIPDLAGRVAPETITLPAGSNFSGFDGTASGSPHFFDDYAAGERIDHVDGVTIEEAEHMIATRLYQNTAKVHFNQHSESAGRFGRRLIYGGHIISLARALSYNGLANAQFVAALNGGSHAAPTFAGDTIYAWSEVLETVEAEGRGDVGLLRLRTVAAKNRPCGDFPDQTADGKRDPDVVLDLDYWAVMPRR